MALGTSNRDTQGADEGITDEQGLYKHLYAAINGEVLDGFRVRQSSTPNLAVRVGMETGIVDSALIRDTANLYPYSVFQTGTAADVTIDTPHSTNPRRDIIVMYLDRGQDTSSAVPNNTNGVVKLAAVKGTPASSPSDPTDPDIQTEIGSNNPFIKLARVRVPSSAPTIVNSYIDDIRDLATPGMQGPHSAEAYIANNSIAYVSGGWANLNTNASRNVSGITYPGITSRTDTFKINRTGWYNIGAIARVSDGGSGEFIIRAVALDSSGTVIRGLSGSSIQGGGLGGIVAFDASVYLSANEVLSFQVFNTSGWRPNGNADTVGANQLVTQEDKAVATRFWAVEQR